VTLKLPYVIDNGEHTLAGVLNDLLAGDPVRALDIATAYFNVGAFELLADGLARLDSFRMLLGAEPESAAEVGLRPLRQRLRGDIDAAPYTEATLRLIESFIRFLRRETVAVRLYQEGFLHAKCYLCFADASPADRFTPVAGVVGSSNFTRAGLSRNRELNLTHKAIVDAGEADDAEARAASAPLLPLPDSPEARAALPLFAASSGALPGQDARRAVKSEVGARAILDLAAWYDARWNEARDFKPDLLELLNASKFGEHEYTPYQVYLKTLYEYFKDELSDATGLPGVRSAVELTEFQEDAVKKARRILARYDGVMIADSVGLGKTWIGKKLLEDSAYHRRQKALVVCPAALRAMWRDELREAAIPAEILSQEMLGRAACDIDRHRDVDILLIDEAHNFRSALTQRYQALERLIAGNGGRGRDGARKKLILLTATPINNSIFDLYHQIQLFTQGDRNYFAAAGIGDLRRFFQEARRAIADPAGGDKAPNATAALFNLLEEVVVRRTRTFIRQAYPQATLYGKPIHWPERSLRTVRYNLEATYAGIYADVVAGIESLTLAHYNLEAYKRSGLERDEWELGREQALVGIFKSRYLKRFESSVAAFRISIRRALEFLETFDALLGTGRLLNSADFRKALQYLEREGEEDDAAPGSQAEALAANDEARSILENLETLPLDAYDLARLRDDLRHDAAVLGHLWQRLNAITPDADAKLAALKALLSGNLRGKKVLLFTYYKDTARYLYDQLGADMVFLAQAGCPRMARLDGDVAPQDRAGRVARFAPIANNRADLPDADEIDLLVATDVLSEGQNLQDCGVVVNYDLHWNPTRMVQRAGRIDRIGALHDVLWIYNVFPEAGLERLLGLVASLNRKIAAIDQAGMLDASILGEVVHPQNFNTLQRIADEDNAVLAEQEALADLVSNEFLLATLRDVLANNPELVDLPDGIHSGLEKRDCRGLFFYFTAPDGAPGGGRRHYWRYYDAVTDAIHGNRYDIAAAIRCGPEEPRVLGQADVFAIQERVIADILRSVQHQQALEAAPKTVDPLQQQVIVALQQHLRNPALAAQEIKAALTALRQSLSRARLKDLRAAYSAYQQTQDIAALLETIREFGAPPAPSAEPGAAAPLAREDLRLVCWEYIWS